MTFSKIRTIFVKELRDTLRDRRTVFATIAVPVMLWPVMTLFMLEAQQTAQTNIRQEQYRVAIQPAEAFGFISSVLNQGLLELQREEQEEQEATSKEDEGGAQEGAGRKAPAPGPAQAGGAASTVTVQRLPLVFELRSDAEAALASGQVEALLVVPPGFEARLRSVAEGPVALGEVPVLEIRYDQAERKSQEAVHRLERVLDHFRRKERLRRLALLNLDEGNLETFVVQAAQNIAPAEKVGGSFLGGLLPVVFIFMIITGALTPAIDLTVGEKERSTLETLIAAPVRTLEVITGKFLVVASLALLNAALNVLSLALTIFGAGAHKLSAFQVPWSAIPAALLLLLPLTLFFAGLLVAVSSFASNYKEAQVYVLPVYILPMLGLIIPLIPGIELQGPLLLVPVVNTSLLIKKLFLGREDVFAEYTFVLVSTTFYAAAAVALATRIFAREEVLFSSQGALRLFLNRKTFLPRSDPRPSDALLIVALLFPANFYFSLLLGQALLSGQEAASPAALLALLLLPQFLIFLGLPLGAAWYLKLDWGKTFSWRRPSGRALLAGALLGSSSWLLALQFVAWQGRFWSYTPDENLRLLEGLLERLPPWLTVAVIAITPALCEEHLFRGFLLGGLRGLRRKGLAVLLVGLCFAVYHLPLYRQPVTFLLGMALAWLAWESGSLWPGILFHLLHNACSAVVGPWLARRLSDPGGGGPSQIPEDWTPPAGYLGVALLVFVAGLWLARGSARREGEGVSNP